MSITKRDLICVVFGIALTLAAFAHRASVQRQEMLEFRVERIEQFLVAAMRGGQ